MSFLPNRLSPILTLPSFSSTLTAAAVNSTTALVPPAVWSFDTMAKSLSARSSGLNWILS